MARVRRWDFLYERNKERVKEFILSRFAEDLARDLAAWPPPFVEWVSEELRARYAAGMADRPREQVVRFALHVAKLDLLRDFDAIDRLMGDETQRHWQTPSEAAAGHLLVRLVTERCLALKTGVTGVRLGRADLVDVVARTEKKLFLVT